MTPQEIVEKFVADWNAMDWDAVVGALSDDVVYHNIPMEKLEGKATAAAFTIKSLKEIFTGATAFTLLRIWINLSISKSMVR